MGELVKYDALKTSFGTPTFRTADDEINIGVRYWQETEMVQSYQSDVSGNVLEKMLQTSQRASRFDPSVIGGVAWGFSASANIICFFFWSEVYRTILIFQA